MNNRKQKNLYAIASLLFGLFTAAIGLALIDRLIEDAKRPLSTLDLGLVAGGFFSILTCFTCAFIYVKWSTVSELIADYEKEQERSDDAAMSNLIGDLIGAKLYLAAWVLWKMLVRGTRK